MQKDIISFSYQDTKNFLNFVKCDDIAGSGIRRFTSSPLSRNMIDRKMAIPVDAKSKPTNYIISSAVNHSPDEWAGSDYIKNNNRKSCFYYLSKKYLADLRKGKAMIMFDQSFEGYQTWWLWDYFHNECKQYNVNPNAVIYVTGNVDAERQYLEWTNINNINDKINVISYTLFESDVFNISKSNLIQNFYFSQVKYKKSKLETIKDFNCLQKRLRPHRIWLYNYLYQAKLLDNGLISMNPYDYENSFFEGRWLPKEWNDASQKSLPLIIYGKNNNKRSDDFYIKRILKEVYLDSWVSVVSEASFADTDQTIFLSEKIFKSIVCYHPFIIAGNKRSLEKLKEMGYATFDGYIDEKYDSLPTFDRFESIINSIRNISKIKEKLTWYESMKDILLHNYNTLEKNSKEINPAMIKLKNCYLTYFRIEPNA